MWFDATTRSRISDADDRNGRSSEIERERLTVSTAAAPPMEERFVDLGGRRLRFLIGGTGKPLVLCHGFISSGEEFGGRFAALASQHTLIAPDLPGNGQSAPLPSRHTAEAMAGSVWELLDHLDIRSFDLAGLCLGASVACAMAADDEGAVDHLILHTPLLGEGLIRAQYRWQVRILTVRPLWAQVAWLSRRRTVSDLYKRIAIEGKVVDPYTANVNYLNQRRANPRAAREWLADALGRQDLDLVRTRAKPTMIIVPEHDRLVNVERLRAMVAPLENVELVVDKQGGHGWSPDAVVRHLALMRLALTD
jgi:pimeloyl-ACP methyl ester carboxylesterase